MIKTASTETNVQQAVLERLKELGLLQSIRASRPKDLVRPRRPLIALEGRPGSRLIVEERR